eukprot:1152055-Pelagomonas_calceolata.AAC.8
MTLTTSPEGSNQQPTIGVLHKQQGLNSRKHEIPKVWSSNWTAVTDQGRMANANHAQNSKAPHRKPGASPSPAPRKTPPCTAVSPSATKHTASMGMTCTRGKADKS